MFARLSLAFVFVSLVAFFVAQPAEAAKGPKITHKVYFDIKHGDTDLGRSMSSYFSFILIFTPVSSVTMGLYGGVRSATSAFPVECKYIIF
jgi:hypothetical protein